MSKMRNGWGRFRRFLNAHRAVSALEYAILVGVIAVGMGAALVAFNNQIKAALDNVQKQIAATPGLSPTPGPTP